MDHDLDQRRWPASSAPLQHPRVKEFFEGVSHGGFDAAPDYELDSAEMRQQIPPIIYDADSSQHSALVDAIGGKNLVIQGPPGTGKSQTITNLIAAAIAGGKRVLFVAEKLAALEVVKRRLDAAGLGAFCLELHSHKTKKKEILADVDERLRQTFSDPSGLDEKLQLLEREKAALNEYVEAINQRVGVSEYTAYEALWAYHRQRTALSTRMPVIESIRFSSAGELTMGRVADLRHALSVFGELLGDIESRWGRPSFHPWAGVKRSELGFADERRVVERLAALAQATKRLLEGAAAMPGINQCSVAMTATGLQNFADEVTHLRKPAGQFDPIVLSGLMQGRATVHAFLNRLEAYRTTLRELSPSVAKIGEVDVAVLRTVSAAVAALLQDEARGAKRLSDVRSDVQVLSRCLADIGQLSSSYEAFRTELRCELPFTLEALRALEVSQESSGQAPLETLGLRHSGLSELGAATTLASAQREASRLRDVRSRLAATMSIELAPSLDTARVHAGVVSAAGMFAFLRSDYRAARRAFMVMRRTTLRPRRSTLRQMYTDLITYLSGIKAFVANGGYRRATGPHFASIDTKFDGLWAVTAWKERLDTELAGFGTPGSTLAAAM